MYVIINLYHLILAKTEFTELTKGKIQILSLTICATILTSGELESGDLDLQGIKMPRF